ncbi:MAG: helix-turn-helix transcriptional regulator [Sphingobacteriaceae bacterium]|nr:helix-turn-helix transcriptional regulator [Sphingobacteriaceae bacterium]
MKNQLRPLRQLANLTQQDLAERVQVSRQTIVSIESGKYVPSTVLALKLADKLGCSVAELFALDAEDWK